MTSAKVVINSASEVIEAFKLFDKNQDGHLTKDEITEFVLGLGGDISGPHFQELLAPRYTTLRICIFGAFVLFFGRPYRALHHRVFHRGQEGIRQPH